MGVQAGGQQGEHIAPLVLKHRQAPEHAVQEAIDCLPPELKGQLIQERLFRDLLCTERRRSSPSCDIASTHDDTGLLQGLGSVSWHRRTAWQEAHSHS